MSQSSHRLLLGVRAADREAGSKLPPWTSDEITAWVTGQTVAAFLIATGWYQGAGSITTRDTMSWAGVGIIGLLLSGVINGYWLMKGRRRVGVARWLLLRAESAPRPEDQEDKGVDRLVSGSGMARFHRPDCQMVAGKKVRAAAREAHTARSRVPCEVCQP